MNRSIMKAAAAVCALSLLTVSAPLSAGAAEWINLSSWAYAEVSGFVSDGLLPETLSGVSDYTRPIKRWELCELLYSVLSNTGILAQDIYGGREFADCDDYPNVNKLYGCSIVEGDGSGNFRPEEKITREDTAVIIERLMDLCGMYEYTFDQDEEGSDTDISGISDADDISDYARAAVERLVNDGIMSGIGGGSFGAKSELSFEQAVILVYRIYERLPRLIQSDNEGMSGGAGQVIQSYENGAEEIWDGNGYILRKDGEELMTFEADVYSKLLCCDYNGETLVFAVNFNDKTDVFRAETGEFLYTIPYIVYKLWPEEGYIYVYSSRFMPAYSGIYGFDGNEITAPEYSETELAELAANGFSMPQEEYCAADGWIYYSNWNDNGHLYKVDSNGENEKLLVDGFDCYSTAYIDGMLYFRAREDDCVYCTDTEGEKLYKISENPGMLMSGTVTGFSGVLSSNPFIAAHVIYYIGYALLDEVSIDGWMLYGENSPVDMEYTDEYSGERESYQLEAYTLHMFRINNGVIERKTITDFPVNEVFMSHLDDDRIFFTNYEEEAKTGGSPLYMYDGTELKCISGDLKAERYGFLVKDAYNSDDPVCHDKIGFVTAEEEENGTYHVIDLNTGEITQESYKTAEDVPETPADEDMQPYPAMSGGGYDVLVDDNDEVYVRSETGTAALGRVVPVYRSEDILYCCKYSENSTPSPSIMFADGSSRNELFAYDMSTGEKRLISDEFMYKLSTDHDPLSFVEATGQCMQVVNGEARTSYPNKGLHRYGEVENITYMQRRIWQPRYLYKYDMDGNFTQLTDCHTEYWLYVPNGSERAELFGQ